MRAIERYPVTALYSGWGISVWFDEQREHLLEGRYPHTPEQFAATDRLTASMRDIEEHIAFAATMAIFLAVIDLESQINVLIFEKFGRGVADATEALPLAKKFELVHSLRGKPFRGTHIYEIVVELVTWRNEYAHGKTTRRPKSLRPTLPDTALRAIPSSEEYAREVEHCLRRYLVVCWHFDHFDGAEASVEAEEGLRRIDSLLDRLRVIVYDKYGQPAWPKEWPRPTKWSDFFDNERYRHWLIDAGAQVPPTDISDLTSETVTGKG